MTVVEMTDATKRKAPEDAEKATAEHTKASTTVEASEGPAAVKGPDAKRFRPSPPDLKVVRKQVEYYLSDENLRYDRFFHEKIAGNADGWLDMSLVLSCNKMKAIRAEQKDVIEALKESKIEVRDDGSALRRPGNAKLLQLEARPTHQKKTSVHAHDGGVLAAVTGVPAEQSWMQVKDSLKEKLPPKVQLWFVSEVTDKSQCIVAASPFENDQRFFEELAIELAGARLKCEVCQGDLLHSSLKLLPKHVRDKRERESRKRQKERNRPILLGTQRFVGVAALRGRVKEILNSRSDGEQLKPDGSDFKLMKALLEYHPRGAEKSKGLVGIKVGKSSKGESRCFYMIKESGEEEDFSTIKCLDAVEKSPPYVQQDAKKAGGDAAKASKPEDPKKEEAKKKEPQSGEVTEEAKAEEKGEAKAGETEERRAEEAKDGQSKAEEKREEPRAEEKKEEEPKAQDRKDEPKA